MRHWTVVLGWALVGCGGGDTDVADTDTDVVDSDTDAADSDTDVVDSDTDVADTDTDAPVELPPTVALPPEAETQGGQNWQLFGGYSRVQMVGYLPADLPSTPFEVTEVRFRRTLTDATDLASTLSLDGVQLWIGTTDAFDGVDMSMTYADNLSGDERKVFDGTLSVAAATETSLDFDDWVVTVDPPFVYDPAQGRLILDLRIPTPSTAPLKFDCQNDGTWQMRMATEAGLPTTAYNATGCGYSTQLKIQAPTPD